MSDLSISSISKKYEILYKSFIERINRDGAFCAVNNAMLFAYCSRLLSLESSICDLCICKKIIADKFGNDLFFSPEEDTNEYKNCFTDAVQVFIELFSSKEMDTESLQIVLGNVLEKHINQRETGAYYTPADTTRYMAWNSIFAALINKCDDSIKEHILDNLSVEKAVDIVNNGKDLLENISILNELSSNEKKQVIASLYKMKIIDPTCGSGAFVIAAFECIEYVCSILGEEPDYRLLLGTLYGLDIEKEAIQLTKIRLLLKIACKSNDFSYFCSDFQRHFICADALKGSDYTITEDGFDWKDFGTKFDCIIGNPPYVEKKNYVSEKFVTRMCVNLYASTIERACNIAHKDTIISLIVPLPLVSTPRMQPAKDYLEKNSSKVYYATFADRPGCIFTGVHQRLVIFFSQISSNEECEKYSSQYMFWYNEERESLFNNITYHRNEFDGILPKCGNDIECNLYKKLTTGEETLFNLLIEKSEYPIYVSTRIGFWAKAFLQNVFTSKEYKVYYAPTEEIQLLTTALFNSSTFYFLWVLQSDCWHITNANISNMRFNLNNINKLDMKELHAIVSDLMCELEKNKKYIGSKQTEFEYKHKYSKSTIDKIDDVIADLFNLSCDEVTYIKEYTEKYRLNTMKG